MQDNGLPPDNPWNNIPPPDDENFEQAILDLIAWSKAQPEYHNNPEWRKEIDGLEQSAAAYSDSVAAEVSAKLMEEIAIDHRDKTYATYRAERDKVIAAVADGAPNAAELLVELRKCIETEKKGATYNPDDWAAIAHLL